MNLLGNLYFKRGIALLMFMLGSITAVVAKDTPNLVITQSDIEQMRIAITQPGRFSDVFQAVRLQVDAQMQAPIVVPVPRDGGGGYTHEQHKKNYQLMYNAGVLFQLTQEQQYADFVGRMLLAYAQLYPTLALHPKRKIGFQNPGKLFWQSLNEAMWLVYTIQAYDLVNSGLSKQDTATIERQLLVPVALFLSEGQPSTFNKVHNHGTWATAGVGMAGYVLNKPEWVEKALLDLDKSGKGGFLRQLDELFSPAGYYNEGPYYQRFALLPFITFAKAIENNEPQRNIFDYRNGILIKAIDTTVQLSYNGLFFPINDAIKSKGIDTIELVHGVAVAYSQTQDSGYLDIAGQQNQILLTGDGLKIAQALDAQKQSPYPFRSVAFGDGAQGEEGALVVMREQQGGNSALVFKPAAQGLGHGHFDKLTWQFYHQGQEIVSDYGAARFLNVEAKFGGRYLPENNSWAKQTVAHNTLVVNEISHFDSDVELGNRSHPTLNFFEHTPQGSVAMAEIGNAYPDAHLSRTMALVKLPDTDTSLVIDVFRVNAGEAKLLDLPLHYQGQLIDTSFSIHSHQQQLRALGNQNGYQHLWLKGEATPERGLASVSWLNDNGSFYTHTSLTNGDEAFLFTQLGANDPNFNLRNESGFIRRVQGKASHQFVSVLEPHGEYNPAKEYTLQAESLITGLSFEQQENLALVRLDRAGKSYLIVINQMPENNQNKLNQTPIQFNYLNDSYSLDKRLAVYVIKDPQE